jgi:Uma2 family endonuclease
MSAQAQPYIAPEVYLERERAAAYKSEYYGGEVFAMSGGTGNHSLLSTNTTSVLHAALKGTGCRVFNSDLRVYIPANGLFTYPDASVVCGDIAYLDERADNLLNPVLLVEVLSPSTESYDRGTKFALYRSIPSLEEYMLVSQDQRRVEVFRKDTTGRWVLYDVEETVELASVGCTLLVDDLYAGVDLPEHPPLR